jgi:hypothetical protein
MRMSPRVDLAPVGLSREALVLQEADPNIQTVSE